MVQNISSAFLFKESKRKVVNQCRVLYKIKILGVETFFVTVLTLKKALDSDKKYFVFSLAALQIFEFTCMVG